MTPLLLSLWACFASTPSLADGPGSVVCELDNEAVSEASGLVRASRSGAFWTHNDSGGKPVLYAFDEAGKSLGSVSLTGASAQDWEELAAFDLDGKRWLLVGDTGDNKRTREVLTLYLVEEPEPDGTGQAATPQRTLRFRYPDGPHDTEGMAVEPDSRTILLVTKDRGEGTRIYTLPLQPASAPVLTATEVARIELGPEGDMSRRRVTAMDLSADGRRLALLTYVDAWVYERAEGQDWASVFAATPTAVPLPALFQREGISWSADGTALYVNSEGVPMPLVRVEAPRPTP